MGHRPTSMHERHRDAPVGETSDGASCRLLDSTRRRGDGVDCRVQTTSHASREWACHKGAVGDVMRVSLRQGVCRFVTTPESGLRRRMRRAVACVTAHSQPSLRELSWRRNRGLSMDATLAYAGRVWC